MKKPKAIILSGYGLNCEEETAFAFEAAGASAQTVHINDLVENKSMLRKFNILAIPGGFSYGDDTGSGKAYANKLKNHLWEELNRFLSKDKLVIGICNGFQILTNLSLLPGVLLPNDKTRYLNRWVDLKLAGNSPWTEGIKTLIAPIAHGEGRYFGSDQIMADLKKEKAIAAVYTRGEVCRYQNLPSNPNGSMENIAAVTSYKGRVLGMMPHPERAMFFTQLPHWPHLKEKYKRQDKKIPAAGPGLELFKNGIRYFK